jgi:hypothetical protein
MGWAPERHVEPERPVPEVVDGRGEDSERDAPGGQVITARPGDADEADRAGRPGGSAESLGGGPREDAEADEHDRGHAAVGHQVRWNPEGVAADQQVPLNVPLRAPDRHKVRSEEEPEACASYGGG